MKCNNEIANNANRKILVVSNMYPSKRWPHYGIFVKHSVEILRNSGDIVDVVFLARETRKIKKILDYAVFYLKAVIKGIFKKYDVIYAHYASHTAIPVLIIKMFNKSVEVVVNVHGNDVIPETLEDKKFLKFTHKVVDKADKIICPSEYYKDVMINQYNVNSDKVYVYPSGGVNTQHFRNLNKIEAKNRLKLNRDYIYIGFVSRLEEKKGWDLFLKAGKRIIEEYKDVRLLVVGNGSQEEQFQKLLTELKLHNYTVKFDLVSQNQLVYVYNAIDIFVFPTYRKSESLGLVGLEAMACGCPVVASDKYGPSSYIENGINGLSFKTGDEKDLYCKIRKYIEMNEKEKKKICDKARKTAESYSERNTQKMLLDIFDRTILEK